MSKNKKITNLIIIDASSSMLSKASEIRDGLKQLLSDIRTDMKENENVKNRTIICQFAGAGSFKVLVNTTKIKKLTDDIADDYKPWGMTALFDAVGQGFNLVGKKQDGVFVNILTDGDENDSKEFTVDMVKKLFAKAKKKKWGLTFMGTTEDAIKSAVSWGVHGTNTFQFEDNSEGIINTTLTRKSSRSAYYNSVLASASLDDIQTENLVDDKKSDEKED